MWPTMMLFISNIIYLCAISWKYILIKKLVKIYNKTVLLSDLLIDIKSIYLDKEAGLVPTYNLKLVKFFIKCKVSIQVFLYISPNIVRYYCKIYNQQITKVIKFILNFNLDEKKIYNDNKKKNKIALNNENIIYTKSNYNSANTDMRFKLLRVGISETIRTQKKIIINNVQINPIGFRQGVRVFSTIPSNFNSTSLIQGLNAEILIDNHDNEISLKFKEWFAGITDGDGYIYLNKEGYVGFEMTLPSGEEKVLRIIQNKFGGNIKARSGVKAIRYRTQNKKTVTKIIKCLNGLIINNIRLAQLHKACLALNIPIKDPITPTIDSAYISGLLDSDGTINIYKHHFNDSFRYQLTISIANKSRCNIEFLLNVIGGNIYYDKSQNGCYFWKANSKLLHFKLYDYFLKFPPKTIKRHRTYLIKEFHELNELKAYRESDYLTMNFKRWKIFISKWDNKN